ncbi:hypothetical protein T439DRAFT_326316 [Meredithblackwellia eburnea MCA 4105]
MRMLCQVFATGKTEYDKKEKCSHIDSNGAGSETLREPRSSRVVASGSNGSLSDSQCR